MFAHLYTWCVFCSLVLGCSGVEVSYLLRLKLTIQNEVYLMLLLLVDFEIIETIDGRFILFIRCQGVPYVIYWKNAFSPYAASHFCQALFSVVQRYYFSILLSNSIKFILMVGHWQFM